MKPRFGLFGSGQRKSWAGIGLIMGVVWFFAVKLKACFSPTSSYLNKKSPQKNMRPILSAGLILIGVVLLFSPVAFAQPANLYTFSGDVDIGRVSNLSVSSGLHYIGCRGDTVYVIRDNGLILCHKSTDRGQSFGPAVLVASGTNPSMKVDTAGIIYVAYQSYDADIYFSKSTDGGQTFASSVKVNDDTLSQTGQEKPSIAVNNKGQIFIAWIDKRLVTWTIYTSVSYDSGITFMSNVNVDTILANRANPDILAEDNGNVYVAYAELLSNVRQITVALSRDSGQSFVSHAFASDLPNDGSSCCAVDPSIASDGRGIVGIAWWESRNDLVTLRFSLSFDYGQTFSPSVIVDTSGYPQFPSLVWKNEMFYLAWRADHLQSRVFFSYSRDSGRSFVPYLDVVSASPNSVNYLSPTLAVNEKEKAFVVWADDRYDPQFNSVWHLFAAVGKPGITKGDLNFDGQITFQDIGLQLNAVFLGQSFPAPYHRADGNCDGEVGPSDMVLLLLRWYWNIPFPCC